MGVLKAGAVLLGGEQQDHCRMVLCLQNLPHQAVVGLQIQCRIRIVYGKFHDHHIRLLAQQVCIHPVYPDVGIRSANACIDKV